MTYSIDFRKKVLLVRQQEGLILDETAHRFAIGRGSIARWLKEVEPKQHMFVHALKSLITRMIIQNRSNLP